MDSIQLPMHLILGIIDGARRIIGDDAIAIANHVEGLHATPRGEIVITQDSMQIVQRLIGAYQKALHGDIVLDVDVRLNVRCSTD